MNQSMQLEVKAQGLSIFCPICGSSFMPSETKTNMCLPCISASGSVSAGITKEGVVNQCRNCRRYQRPPYVYCERESKELLALCLKKIRGLNQVKIIEAGFVYTEPHSRRIKVKLTIQKEVVKNVEVQESFVVEFTEHYQQCEDCQKEFTPHTWGAVVQLRQHAIHKKTLFYLEQAILKHNAHEKCVKVQEEENGMDFYFKNRQTANKLVDFLETLIANQFKTSKQLLGTDEQNGTQTFKFSYSISIPKVCKDDLVIFPEKLRKQMGASTGMMLCLKINQSLKFLDTNNFNIYEVQSKKYFEYEPHLIIVPFQHNKHEYLILDCEVPNQQTVNTSFQTLSHKICNITLQCTQTYDVLQVKCHLGDVLRPGDIYIGFNVDGLTNDFDEIKNMPQVVLIRRKRETKRSYKVKRMEVERKKSDDAGLEEFMEQLDQDKDLRTHVNLYGDKQVIEEKKRNNLLKKVEKRKERKEEERQKIRVKRQFEDLKNESLKPKENQQDEEEWQDEDGININELINDLNIDDQQDNTPDLLNPAQVDEFIKELDKIKISK